MLLKKVGVIKDMLLPAEFVQGEHQFGGMGNNWRLIYYPRKYKDESPSPVQLISYYRGSPPIAAAGEAFRVMLSQPPQILFAQEDGKDASAVTSMVKNLGAALGSASDNQLVNQKQGLHGPIFYLQKLAVAQISKRSVLIVSGVFHRSGATPDEFQFEGSTNYSHALLFDAASGSEPCRIEEIVLQADTAELLGTYLPLLDRALNTVRWADR